MQKRSSPMDLRDGLERESLEPYEPPRMLLRQANVDTNSDFSEQKRLRANNLKLSMMEKSKQNDSLRQRISKRIARLSSLESQHSSSSMELDPDQQRQIQHNRLQQQPSTPLISITSNDFSATISATGEDYGEEDGEISTPPTAASSLGPPSSRSQTASTMLRRAQFYRDYYGRSRGNTPAQSLNSGRFKNKNDDDDDDDDEEDDDDAFEDAPLPMPYSSSSMARSVVVRQQTEGGVVSYPTTSYGPEMFDDRQGMNNSEQLIFTKAEKVAHQKQRQRASSLDGSIISELRLASSKKSSVAACGGKGRGRGKGSGKSLGRGKRRSKSPSSTSMSPGRRRGGHSSRRGFLGLMSRLKLTKKHESIARLQLYLLNSGLIPLKTLDRDLATFLPCERLSVKEFQERVRLMRNYEVLSTIEYRFASKYETYVCKHAQQELNQPKNNYKKCIPYDYNRVVLRTLPNVPDSDYINASHVDSCLKPNAYIATQGPNEFTINDFWRMIWEQKTFVIVMLTKVFDFIRVMCNQYWPVELNKPERYGNIEVTLLYEEPLADFVIRTIKISKLRGVSANVAQDNQTEQQQQQVSGANQSNGTRNGQTIAAAAQQVDESEQSSDEDDEDATDVSLEDLILNEAAEGSNQNLTVRAPRFLRASRRGQASRRLRADDETNPNRDQRSASAPRELTKSASQKKPRASSPAAPAGPTRPKPAPPPNEFLLHPLFNSAALAASLSSLASEPTTPITPRTPSSAGLDRSSATRKAVKKKRREVVKNQRPKRTQFLVPSESQLLDDDDDEEDDKELDEDDEEDEEAEDEPDEQDVQDELSGDQIAARSRRRKGSGKRQPRRRRQASERIIYQFHYNSWASHTCPFISSLLHFRRRVRICMDEMSKSGRTGPTVVHCNDGCGRTGAYLCIDANLELADEDNVLDIYNYTRKMRQSRKFLIENLEQYKFVYDTIEEAIYCGRTWFPVAELHKRLKQKAQKSPVTRKNEYLLEYEKICRMTSKFSIGDCAGGHRVENREKNRDVSTVPPDNFRPYLSSFQTNDSTDYINAVFVDGYTRSKEYIVTEWPLHRTISDFWSLVYDHDCNSVILLANPSESSNYPSFLPGEKELRRRFGPVFSAEMVSYTHYQNIKSWIYTINKKIVSLTEVIAGVKSETKTTKVFQITCWPQGHRVPTSTNALVELMNMVEKWRQRTTYGPVCVVSLNGKSRAGVYCAANVAIEQVVQHSEVDVFNAVKTVRRHRPQLIENMTEYKYCYDLILHYVLHYVNRAGDS